MATPATTKRFASDGAVADAHLLMEHIEPTEPAPTGAKT